MVPAVDDAGPLEPGVFATTRSNTAWPRTPFCARCNRATVAGDLRPSKLPVRVSLAPTSVAVTAPDPAIVAIMAVSIGTGDNRVR